MDIEDVKYLVERDVDPYPLVLEIVGAALKTGTESGAMSHEELTVLRALRSATTAIVQAGDPESVGLVA